MNRTVTLFKDDFKHFKIGEFPYDRNHSAMGEYNYIVNEGDHGNWVDMVCNHTYNGSGASWIITEDEGKHFMEQMRLIDNRPHKTHPMLMTGSDTWNDYTVSAKVRLLNTDGSTGIGFKCINSLNLYVLVLEDNKVKLLYRHKQQEKELVTTEFAYNCDDYYELKAECMGDTVHCHINGKKLFSYTEPGLARSGKIAVTATTPAQFTDVVVLVSETTMEQMRLLL